MWIESLLVALFLILVLGLLGWFFRKDVLSIVDERLKLLVDKKPAPPPVVVNLDGVHRALDQVPNKVLQSIISSSNNLKGNLGELIGYLKLHAEYDRIIPLGNIVDFIAIKLPKDGQEGHIDFIDIKTGKAKLSKDQVQLKKLIEEKKINFLKLKVEASKDETGTE